MDTNIDIVATDDSGSYRVRKLKTTGRGARVQVLEPAGDTGLHRTWHPSGYVHDRTANPPSTTSTGQLARPAEADCECWAREDLRAGALAGFQKVGESTEAFVIDLRVGTGFRRFEAWYVAPECLSSLLESLQTQAVADTLLHREDEDAGRVRVLAAFEPRAVAA